MISSILFELVGNHYTSYKRVNDEVKTLFIKNYLFELFIDTKKDLHLAENPLLKGLKYLNLYFGTAERDEWELFDYFMIM